jgi:Cdc6-like AAA superfamily ATPase
VNENMQTISRDVKDVVLTQKQQEIFRWLSPSDPSTNYNKALSQRQEGTGLWFVQSSCFQRWQTRQNSFVWLHGIPGCGKTILSSTIISYIEKTYPERLLLYFYFDFTDSGKQTLENVVRSLIGQLYRKRTDAQMVLDSLFSSYENGRRQPGCESLCKVFLQMINQAEEVYLVLDALDECQTRKGMSSEGLLLWLETLLQPDQRNLHLLVTSRPEHDIEIVLYDLAKREEDIVPIQSDLIRDDIRSYIHTTVREKKGLKRWNSRADVLEEIETQLMEKANGM